MDVKMVIVMIIMMIMKNNDNDDRNDNSLHHNITPLTTLIPDISSIMQQWMRKIQWIFR